jgi:hypothetical protein
VELPCSHRPRLSAATCPCAGVDGVFGANERRVVAGIERLYHRGAGALRPVAARPCGACAARHRWASVAVLAAAWTTLALAMLGAVVSAAALATGTSVSWLLWCYLLQPAESFPGPR